MGNELAIVFPGQGSQSVGMVNALSDRWPSVRDTFGRASDALGMDLWRLAGEGPEEELNLTVNTQPALLAAGYAVWRIWREEGGPPPALLAGHSLGEYTALVCAGALGFEDAVRLVAERGRCMQEAVPAGTGAMAAVLGLENDVIERICGEASGGEVVSPANYNSPGQVVIAGDRGAVERAVERCKAAGARRAVLLPVSVPSHCALMRPAAEAFRKAVDAVEFRDADIDVVQNVDARARVLAAEIRPGLMEQMHRPVQWVEVVRCMKAKGAERILEFGPGKVLAGLIKRIDRDIACASCGDPESLNAELEKCRSEQGT